MGAILACQVEPRHSYVVTKGEREKNPNTERKKREEFKRKSI